MRPNKHIIHSRKSIATRKADLQDTSPWTRPIRTSNSPLWINAGTEKAMQVMVIGMATRRPDSETASSQNIRNETLIIL